MDVFCNRNSLPHDHTVVALEDKTRELKAATLKLALLEEQEPTARAASAYGQLMQRMGKYQLRKISHR